MTTAQHQHRFPGGPAGLMLGLFESAAPHLTDDDLANIAARTEEAADLVSQMGELCMGLGCLVDADTGANRTGTFQEPDDLANLLFLLSSMASHAAATLGVAHSASSLQERRRLVGGAKAKGGRS